MKTKKIVVLAGGPSSEREVSFMSSESVLKTLKDMEYDVTLIDPDQDLVENLKKHKPDVVFNCLHGTYGEDGAIPGILEYLRIPYTHSGVLASATCFNKVKTNEILRNHGVKVPNSIVVGIEELRSSLSQKSHLMPVPYVIKPIAEGSTVGVYIIQNENEKPDLTDWKYGDQVMLEEYIPGMELTCTVFDDEALVVTELAPKSGFYDYEAKYTDGMVEHILPARIPDTVTKLCMEYSEKAHEIMDARTISRSDFRYNGHGAHGLYFLEINTHPGFTSLSLVPEAAKYVGLSFEDLCQKLIDDAKLEMYA